MKYLICNLKENKKLEEIKEYEIEISKLPKSKTKLIICPSYLYLTLFNHDNYELGSQDISMFNGGSYTGEISGEQLKSVNTKYVLIGHSERKRYFNEDEKTITKKINNCFKNNLIPIYLVGETKEEKERGKTLIVLEKQIARIFNNYKIDDLSKIMLVYEPVWAIDNEKELNYTIIKEAIVFIKNIIKSYYNLEIPILYGGSINSNNISILLNIKEIDGFLIGKSSLDISKISDIYQTITKFDNN